MSTARAVSLCKDRLLRRGRIGRITRLLPVPERSLICASQRMHVYDKQGSARSVSRSWAGTSRISKSPRHVSRALAPLILPWRRKAAAPDAFTRPHARKEIACDCTWVPLKLDVGCLDLSREPLDGSLRRYLEDLWISNHTLMLSCHRTESTPKHLRSWTKWSRDAAEVGKPSIC